ncbi:MAG TPA: hypothetical protein VMG12_30215 [Polyangiaceae bacterium]|nr:hypothetical protein [Polyangiaceae bacterium]
MELALKEHSEIACVLAVPLDRKLLQGELALTDRVAHAVHHRRAPSAEFLYNFIAIGDRTPPDVSFPHRSRLSMKNLSPSWNSTRTAMH